MSDNSGDRMTSSDDFWTESSSTPVIDQLPKTVKVGGKTARPPKPPRPAARPRPVLAWKAVLPSRRVLGGAGVLLGLVVLAGAAFLAVRALGDGGCEELSATRTTAGALDGLRITVRPDALRGAFGVKLSTVPQTEFSAASANADVKAAASALPATAKPASGLFQVRGCNTEPRIATLSIQAPAQAQALDEYALYGYDAAAKRWRWLGAEIDPTTRSVTAHVTKLPSAALLVQVPAPSTGLSTELAASGATLDGAQLAGVAEVSPIGLYLGENGQIVGDRSRMASVTGSARVVPVIRNWSERGEVNRTLLKAMLTSDRARDAHIANVVDMVTRLGDYAGVEIDYRGVETAQREAFSQFATKLGDALHAKGKTLTVGLPAPIRTNSVDPETMWNTEGYDVRALSAAADQVKLDLSADPALFQPEALDALMAWAQSRIGKDKLEVVVSALSVKQGANGATQFISNDEAIEPLGKVVPEQPLSAPLLPGQKVRLKITGLVDPATVQFDEATGVYRYSFTDANGQLQTVWMNTPASLKRKLDLLKKYSVREVNVRGLDAQGGEAVAQALTSLGQPAAATATGTLAWTVNGAPDTAAKGSVFEWTAPDQPGKYVIGASMTGTNDRGTVNVEVVRPTPTPVPPTPTPRPVVRAQPAAQPAAAAAAQPAAAAAVAPAAAAAPAAPRPSGSASWLGVGAHIDTGNNMNGFLARMRGEAGMTWVKVQVVFGGGAPDITWMANMAHANGIKLLVGAIGDRGRFRDPSYYPTFAAGVAAMARQGADAIEIWNEPNLDREVGGANVSPENYAELLKQSYAAIKAANPGTLVVGGAMAPTGYFGGNCGPGGCDDKPFLERLRNLGAGNFMDCIGAHYNGSPNPPGLRSGGPTGDHYSWYFFGTLDTTYGAIGKPVCFTELGYVTKDGVLPSLPGGFSWGNNITLGNQAQWTAEAITLARQSGKVRMVIIWNANFHRVDGSDPQVGYSIFRPDGSCPACGPIRAASQ